MPCLLALSVACTRSDKPTASKASAAPSVAEQRDKRIIGPAQAKANANANANANALDERPSVPGVRARASGSTRCVVPSPNEAPPPAEPAKECPADPGDAPELPWGSVTFSDAPDTPRVRVELATSNATRSRGLMYRTELEQDQGMLFSWPDERRRSFWMKNTCIPLDMLFIDREGTIVGILENVPVLNQASRGVHCPAAHVLEVNAGWTRQHGVFAGQKVEIEP